MEIIHLSVNNFKVNLNNQPTVLAIGFFDGVHLGHQQVLQQAKDYAQKHQLKFAVMTFDPHPSVVLSSKHQRTDYLTPLTVKEQLLEKLGVELLYITKFTSQFSKLSPQQFVQQFLVALNIQHVFCGFDFRYGCSGEGTPQNIYDLSNQTITITIVDKQALSHQKISTTRIRHYLSEGQLTQANAQLGRIYATEGIVVQGEKRGRQLGFPTANIEMLDNYYIPSKTGVYAVRVYINKKWYEAMANIGYKPTFHAQGTMPLTIEINIFDFNQDIYGEKMRIEWYQFMREEQTFNGIDALISQIKQDKTNIQNYFNEMEINNEKVN